MEMKTLGPGAGWSWLMRGIKSGFKRPKTLFGAVALFLAFVIALVLVPLLVQWIAGQSPTAMLISNVVVMLVSVVVYPVLCGGYLRILDAVEHERPAAATDLFGPFQAGGGAARLILVGIGLFVVYALFLALLYFTIGHGLGTWYLHVIEAGMHGMDKPSGLPALPDGMAATFAILVLFLIFYSAAFAIAMGQAALRDQPVMSAIKVGMMGAIKNLLPLLVLALCSFLAFFVFMIGVGIVVGIVAMLGALVSSVLGVILIVPLYVALMLLMYVVMLGVMYAMWQDIAGGGQGDAGAAPPAQVEV